MKGYIWGYTLNYAGLLFCSLLVSFSTQLFAYVLYAETSMSVYWLLKLCNYQLYFFNIFYSISANLNTVQHSGDSELVTYAM